MGALAASDNFKTNKAAVLETDLAHDLIATLAGPLARDQELRGVPFFCQQFAQNMGRSCRFTFARFLVPHEKQINGGINSCSASSVLHPDYVCGDYGLHIGSATAPQVIPFNAGLKLRIIGIGLDNIKVPAEHNRRFALAGEGGENGRKFSFIQDPDLELRLAQVIIYKGSCPVNFIQSLPAGRGVCHRRNTDELLGQIDDFGSFVWIAKIKPRSQGRLEANWCARFTPGLVSGPA
jgi:hypothetical protein